MHGVIRVADRLTSNGRFHETVRSRCAQFARGISGLSSAALKPALNLIRMFLQPSDMRIHPAPALTSVLSRHIGARLFFGTPSFDGSAVTPKRESLLVIWPERNYLFDTGAGFIRKQPASHTLNWSWRPHQQVSSGLPRECCRMLSGPH